MLRRPISADESNIKGEGQFIEGGGGGVTYFYGGSRFLLLRTEEIFSNGGASFLYNSLLVTTIEKKILHRGIQCLHRCSLYYLRVSSCGTSGHRTFSV